MQNKKFSHLSFRTQLIHEMTRGSVRKMKAQTIPTVEGIRTGREQHQGIRLAGSKKTCFQCGKDEKETQLEEPQRQCGTVQFVAFTFAKAIVLANFIKNSRCLRLVIMNNYILLYNHCQFCCFTSFPIFKHFTFRQKYLQQCKFAPSFQTIGQIE